MASGPLDKMTTLQSSDQNPPWIVMECRQHRVSSMQNPRYGRWNALRIIPTTKSVSFQRRTIWIKWAISFSTISANSTTATFGGEMKESITTKRHWAMTGTKMTLKVPIGRRATLWLSDWTLTDGLWPSSRTGRSSMRWSMFDETKATSSFTRFYFVDRLKPNMWTKSRYEFAIKIISMIDRWMRTIHSILIHHDLGWAKTNQFI